jgi:MoaA/NifB/PqqE/SkfB family radical SAM enzyme
MNSNDFSLFYRDYVESINKFNIDITYICPLECPFCIRQSSGFKQKIKNSDNLSIDDFNKIIKTAKHIGFCGQVSDPIYHTNFIEIMKIVYKNKHKSFSIHTNGTRKKLDWWNDVFSLSHPNVRWIFGLDGTDQESANIHRVNTRFDEVFNVMKIGASKNVNIIWQFIVFKHNEHQIEQARHMASEHNIVLHILKSNRWQSEEIMKNFKIELPSEQWMSKGTEQKVIFYPNNTTME